jgi:23S rRNA pseudouridine1911/1915/1917 synthase
MDNIPIIFENNNFLVINKPSGLVVHPYDHSTEETLLDFLACYSPEVFLIANEKKLMDGRTINLGGLVHKLDRDTSGLMVIAKNKASYEALQKLFKSHDVTKVYEALVDGILVDSKLIIDAPLGRNKKDYKQTAHPKNLRGELRDALTEVHTISHNEVATLVELFPKTGRTHQLRAHMAYVGHPIVGDKAYGSTLESDRILLHAKKLNFVLLGESYSFESATPFTLETLQKVIAPSH